MEKRLHKHPENITTKIMETNTTGGWKETTTRMREQINETLHNTKNEYINPQQLKRYFRHNIEKTSGDKNEDTILARKYKLVGRGTTKIHERIEENGSIHHLQSEKKNAGREEQLQGEIQEHILETCTGIHDDTTKIKYKLELCAFTLKGEHNVYSLVPNIAVCIYIYILTKSEFISSCSRPAVGSNIVQITRATFLVNVFFKMATGSHFGCPKINLYRFLTISDQYHNFYFCEFILQNGCRRPFWMSESDHFRSHFWPFEINTKLSFFLFLQNGQRRPFWMSEIHF